MGGRTSGRASSAHPAVRAAHEPFVTTARGTARCHGNADRAVAPARRDVLRGCAAIRHAPRRRRSRGRVSHGVRRHPANGISRPARGGSPSRGTRLVAWGGRARDRRRRWVRGFDAYFDRLFAHYADAGAWQVYPEVPDVLAVLRARGVALAVVSNFDSRLSPLLEALGIASFFDAVVCSGEVGVAKPDRAIFAHALAALGVEAPEALHVGDSRKADYDGARAAGIDALLVDRRAVAAPPGTILDLRGILDRW